MTHHSHLTEWERARQYIAWMRRHGFSKETMLTLPDHQLLDINQDDRALLRNLIKAG